MWRIATTRTEETARSKVRQCSTQICCKFHFRYILLVWLQGNHPLLIFYMCVQETFRRFTTGIRALFGTVSWNYTGQDCDICKNYNILMYMYVYRVLLRPSEMMIWKLSRRFFRKRKNLPHLSMQEIQMRYVLGINLISYQLQSNLCIPVTMKGMHAYKFITAS